VARPEQDAKGVSGWHALRILLRACHPEKRHNLPFLLFVVIFNPPLGSDP
jgi:hypothetical protein